MHHAFANYLESRNSVIGYNANVPPDADSSAWGMFALTQGCFAIQDSLFHSWVDFIFSHWVECGHVGLSTYAANSPIIEYKRGWHDFSGWTGTPCEEITILAFFTFCRLGKVAVVEGQIESWITSLIERGDIQSYWWTSRWYVLRLLTSFLIELHQTLPRLQSQVKAALKIALSVAQKEINAPQEVTPFDVAARLLSCANLRRIFSFDIFDKVIDNSIGQLLSTQKDDGSWVSANIMRIPYPNDISPWKQGYFVPGLPGTGGILSDSGVLTTASASYALDKILRLVREGK